MTPAIPATQSNPTRDTLYARIAAYVAATEQRNLELLFQMLSIPKPRMQEHRAVRFAADLLRGADCDVDIFEGDGAAEPAADGKPINVLGRRAGCADGVAAGRSLLLEAHLDTVPTGQLNRWKHDPWGATVEAGRVYARGAHDDVAGAALVCLVARALQELKLTPQADLYLLLTTEEEYSGGGMRALRQRHPQLRPDAHLLVDGNSQPQDCIIGHPGCVSFTIRIPGPFGSAQNVRYVHDANPIELAGRLIAALRRLEEDLARQTGEDVGSVSWPRPTIAIVGIQSAGWISNVPEECNLQVWGNVIPPMTIPCYRDAIESCIRGEAQALPWFAQHPPRIEWGPVDVPAMLTPVDSPFYRALAAAHRRSFGTDLRPRLIGGWGDMRLLDSPQMLFYGPGRGGGDHGYDEYYEIADLAPMLRTLLHLVADWCGVS